VERTSISETSTAVEMAVLPVLTVDPSPPPSHGAATAEESRSTPTAPTTLKHRVLRGGVWLASGDIIARLATLFKLAILVRLLNPVHFGLLGMAMIVLRWLNAFTDVGIRDALIRKEGDIRPYFDTSWTIQIARGCFSAAVLCLTAPWMAAFFDNAELTAVLRGVALVPFLYGFRNPAVVTLRKKLDLRGEMIWKLSGVIAGFAVAVPLAFLLRSVWALVISAAAAAAAEVVASYWVLPYRPKLRADWRQAREMSTFGKWILFSNIGGLLFLSLDGLVIGKLLGAEPLGIYQLGYQLAVMPMAQIGLLANSLLFPAFSELRQPNDLRRAFLKSMGLACSVLLPIGCFLAVCAEPVVRLAFGPRWDAAAPVVRILAGGGVALAISMLGNAFFLGLGKPRLASHVSMLRLALLAGLLYPAVQWYGLTGAAMAVAAAAIGAAAWQFVLLVRFVGPSLRETADTMTVGLLGSLLIAAAAGLATPALSPPFLAWISLAMLAYLALLFRALRDRYGLLSAQRWGGLCAKTLKF
jgi:O-antigen/teichoic acid export membrane protein